MAVKVWVAPSARVAGDGFTVIEARGPGSTVTERLPVVQPVAEAVTVGVPATVSS